jgi:nicotinate-nucleotide pyrophosphorylase (carboxylating)
VGRGDITTRYLVKPRARGRAQIVAKASGVLAGQAVANAVFHAADRAFHIRWHVHDGSRVKKGDVLCDLEGRLSAMLTAERVALNFLTWLSGIATCTSQFVQRVKGTRAAIYDTRKTTPLWRDLEKYAVRMGGGNNHRMGLWDMAFIKDNHWMLAPGVREVVRRIRSLRGKSCVVELNGRNVSHLAAVVAARPEVLLLDNFSASQVRKLAKQIRQLRSPALDAPAIEVSGGITVGNVRQYARAGAERISVGAITHSAPALDMSLEIVR